MPNISTLGEAASFLHSEFGNEVNLQQEFSGNEDVLKLAKFIAETFSKLDSEVNAYEEQTEADSDAK